MNFQASLAARWDHVTAFGQWNASGCAALYQAMLGPYDPDLGDHDGRATGGRKLDPCVTSWRRAAHPSGTPIFQLPGKKT